MRISYDLHIHSCLSPCGDNDMTPNNIVNMAKISGLDVIAVSDHNSAKNLSAVFNVAKKANLIVVPAVEVCTSEEIHMLCYFCSLDDAISFSKEIYPYLPLIRNNESIFGSQLVLDKDDCIINVERKLLINALTIGIDKLLLIMIKYNGVVIPAHVDKSSYSIISSLGHIPDEYNFRCIEVKDSNCKVEFDGLRIYNSDAHYLGHINEPINFLDVDDKSICGIINKLKGI